MSLWRRWFGKRLPEAAEPAPAAADENHQWVSAAAFYAAAAALATPKPGRGHLAYPTLPELPAIVAPQAPLRQIAQDYAGADAGFAFMYQNLLSVDTLFPGYQVLAQWSLRPEYRTISDTNAEEMIREWIQFESTGDGDKSAKIDAITTAMEKHHVKDMFRKMVEMDGFFGCGHLYIDLQGTTDELRATPLILDPRTIRQGSLKGFRPVEPCWCSPQKYNTTDPTDPTFYQPQSWIVIGTETHSTRLLTFISREVSDLFKASFNFGGMSLSQLARPYVENWLRTRDSVGDVIHSFSMTTLATDMDAYLNTGASQALWNRLDLMGKTRDNRSVNLINRESEEISQINTPLSGLDALQAQAQEQMASVSRTPLVKLLGVTPSGLNASSDGEIKTYYDHIKAQQENLFRDPLTVVIQIIQLDLFGQVDPDLKWDFVPLWQLDGKELADVRKADADAGANYVDLGIISPEEERQRLSNDPLSGYSGIDPHDTPTPPENTEPPNGTGNPAQPGDRTSVPGQADGPD